MKIDLFKNSVLYLAIIYTRAHGVPSVAKEVLFSEKGLFCPFLFKGLA